MQKSIFTRYFSVCVTLIMVSIVILGIVFLVFASEYFKNDKYNLLKDNANDAVSSLEGYDLKSYDIYSSIVSNKLIAVSTAINADIFLVDENGALVYCTEKEPCIHSGITISEDIRNSISSANDYFEMGKLDDLYSDRYYTIGVSCNAADGFEGYLFLSSQAADEHNNFLTEMLKMFLLSAAAVLLITFVAVYFVSMQLVKPLRKMSAAAQSFGRGDFSARLEVSGYDEMGQLAMALNNMAESLSTLEVSRRSFVANVSHELKTPMTSISGFIDGILDGTIPKEQEEHYLKIVSAETKRLSGLVRTMLNLSKIEAGEMTINKQPINIVDTICRVVFSFEKQIEDKHLDIRGLDHSKVLVNADPDLIHQVAYNLVENAVKFVNDGGYLEFDFKIDGSKVNVSIKNSGEGLSKEELPKIFDRFYKTDKSRGTDKNGVGLGLYIVRSVVALHGGDVSVRSAKGEYVEFIVTLDSVKATSQIKKVFSKNENKDKK